MYKAQQKYCADDVQENCIVRECVCDWHHPTPTVLPHKYQMRIIFTSADRTLVDSKLAKLVRPERRQLCYMTVARD